jgi:hypothetical protein
MSAYPSYRSKIFAFLLLFIWKSASQGRNIAVLFVLLSRFMNEMRDRFQNEWDRADNLVYIFLLKYIVIEK